MLCSRQEIHSLTRKYFLSAYCVPGPVVGAGHGGGGGRSGLVPGGCVGPGLRARREAVCSGRIQVPGCSRRGGDGQGGAGSCPVWSSIGMEAGAVGVGHVVGCLWGRGRIWPGGVGGGFQAPGIPFFSRSIWPDFYSGRWSQGGWTVGSRTLSFCLLSRDI